MRTTKDNPFSFKVTLTFYSQMFAQKILYISVIDFPDFLRDARNKSYSHSKKSRDYILTAVDSIYYYSDI